MQKHIKIMKNVHVILTDNPSRLYIDNKGKYSLDIGQIDWKKHQNLFITSDEEIKEGDWFYLDDAKIIAKYINVKPVKEAKKIILTTDQDLIKDGVQAIDDEFLKWFVMNPSCEEVEVKHYNNQCSGECGICDNTCGDWHKIIIPQEEPKQETLEEAAEKYAKGKSSSSVFQEAHKRDFIEGAKLQQEQNKNKYSEEDMKYYALKCVTTYLFNGDFISDNLRKPIVENNNKQFEKFKNK